MFEVKLEHCSCLEPLGHSNGASGLAIYNNVRKYLRRHFLKCSARIALGTHTYEVKGGRKKSLKSSVFDSFRILIPSSEKFQTPLKKAHHR